MEGKRGLANRRDDVCVLLAYAAMAIADSLGVVTEKVGLTGISSVLFFLWFAVIPLPAGALCCRLGVTQVLRVSLVVSIVACAFIGMGGAGGWAVSVGVCLAGLANVVLQVAAPALVAERFPANRLAVVLTGGAFVKTLAAIAFPFAVTASSALGCWQLALVPFCLLAILAACAASAHAGAACRRSDPPAARAAFRRILKDPVARCAVAAFAVAIVVDIAFNLSVPTCVARRFAEKGNAAGTVYAVWFGVKLPLMLLGARCFSRWEARRFFFGASLAALVGAATILLCDGWLPYLAGVGLFAAGFANVYGHVFGAVAPRHRDDGPAVSALLVMAVSAGAAASPLLAAADGWGTRGAEGLVLALLASLIPLAAYLTFFRGKR